MVDNILYEGLWRNRLGLFPMPLFQDKYPDEKFILLNGGSSGNLCLDFRTNDINEARINAWSADVGHYLAVSRNTVTVFRWDTFKSKNYDTSSILYKLDEFYEYLKKQEFNSNDSIVKFCIHIYRQIRSILRDNNGGDSLNSLLFLFACIADGNTNRNDLKIENWSISNETKSIVTSINSTAWDELQDLLVKGLQSKGLKPDINLLLRHASGTIFQEAHFETLFPSNYQPTLPGLLPKIDERLGVKSRNQTSAHYTPTSIVRTIVEELINNYSFVGKIEITAFDPACGSGEFLKEFVRQIKLKGFTGKINLIGWDISATAIDMAAFIINHEIQPYKEFVNIKLEKCNALSTGKPWEVKADFILMNPPFLSLELMDEEIKENVASILGPLFKKRPNVASAFFWNAVHCLKNDGVIGCVLPTSIFENESYVPLREEIRRIIDVKIIGRVGSNTLFTETLVDTAIFLGVANKSQVQLPIVFWSDYRTESASNSLRELRKFSSLKVNEEIDEKGYSLYQDPNLIQNETWMPIPLRSLKLLERYKDFPKVEALFDVRQGVRTGMNSVFLVTRTYFDKLPIREKKYFRPAVTSESIINGQLNDNYYIFYAEGAYEIHSLEQLELAVPNFYKDILQLNFKKLSARARKGEHNFWKLSEHRAWQVNSAPKIVSKEFGSAGSFAFDKTGIFIAERSHAWLPKNNIILGELGYAYICVLSMPVINNFLTGLSKQLGGGEWWYLSSKYINKMPIPDLFEINRYDTVIIEQLIDLGIQISNGQVVEKEQLIRLSNIVYNG